MFEGMLEVDVVLEAVDFLNFALLENSQSEKESKEPTLSKKRKSKKQTFIENIINNRATSNKCEYEREMKT